MKLNSQWLLENKAILLTMFEPAQNEAEIEELDQLIESYFSASSAETIHLIFDTRNEIESLKVRLVVQMTMLQDPRMGWSIMVAPSGAIQRFVGLVVSNTKKSQYRQCESLEEAILYLASADPHFDANLVDRTLL